MRLVARPIAADIFWQVFYKEPQFELAKEEQRISIVNEFLKTFDLRLNDLKFNAETLSNNFIHFAKFYDQTFLDVSFGLEEIGALLRSPQNEAQVMDLLNGVFKIFKDNPFSSQRCTVTLQCSVEGDIKSYFETLSPYTPTNFENIISGRGLIYTLKVQNHELSIQVLIANSLYVEGGLYLNLEFNFSPSLYGFREALQIVQDQEYFIEKELNLEISRET